VGTLSENEVFDAIVDLVARGEYLDEIPGVPQPSTAGGGGFKALAGGMYARLYTRGSDEYLEAKSNGLIEPLPAPPYPPAGQALVDEAEQALGCPLPSILRRLYLEVANGGFGPGYGILGLSGGHGLAPDGTAIERYRRFREWDEAPPSSLFPVCDWGCAISSFVDCSDRDAVIWGLDPNPVDDISDALFPQEMGLVEWLQLWIEGRLCQPWALQDPVTGEWRGATNDETTRALLEDWDPDDELR
jgi:hypothetical protein